MLSTQVDDNGMLLLRARLTPEVGAVLLRAVQAALEQVPAPAAPAAEGNEPTIAQWRADALGLVAESALAGGLDPGNPGDRFQVTVHVPADALASREPAITPPHVAAETSEASAGACVPAPPAAGLDAGQAVIEQADGLHLGREAARRLACDAALVALRHGADGEVLDIGRRTRAVPTALRRALQNRDRSQCQFPAATPATATPTTSCTGPMAGRPGCRTWSYAVGSTTARCTKMAFRW